MQGLQSDAIDAQYNQLVNNAVAEQRAYIDKLDKSNYIAKDIAEFKAFHQQQLSEITDYIQGKIREVNSAYILKQVSIDALHELFCQMVNVE